MVRLKVFLSPDILGFTMLNVTVLTKMYRKRFSMSVIVQCDPCVNGSAIKTIKHGSIIVGSYIIIDLSAFCEGGLNGKDKSRLPP